MANLCFDEVTIYGDKDKVKTIYDFLTGLQEELNIHQISLSYIKDSLDFSEYDGDLRYFIDNVELKDDRVIITAELANTAHEEFFDILADNFDVDYCMYADYADEGLKVVINDPEGIIYPVEYILDVYEENDLDIAVDEYHFNNLIDWCTFCEERGIPLNDQSMPDIESEQYEEIFDNMNFYTVEKEFSNRGYDRQDNYTKYLETEEKEDIER